MRFRFFKSLSIKRKLAFINLLTAVISLVLACTAFIVYESVSFRHTMLRELSIITDIIGRNSTAALTFDAPSAAEDILSALGAERHIVSACIYEPDNGIFATYVRPGALPEFPESPDAAERAPGEEMLVLTRPILLEGDPIGTVYLKYDLREVNARVSRYLLIAFAVILISSGIALTVANFLQRAISAPILHLADVAYTVSLKNDYSLRARLGNRDEVGQLIEGFNEMLAQIQERDQALIKAREGLERRVQERTQELKGEIFERIRIENRLRESLSEKEVLLKEIHHRVKNNLQVISSLLYLQSKKIRDRPALEMFVESQDRVRSMALIHERMYQSEDLVHIDFAEYIRSLIGHLSNTYGAQLKNVQTRVLIQNVMLAIDKGIPCGLIINELVTNALKYAFPDGRHGTITIEIAQDGAEGITLSVRDNGVGLPASMDVDRCETLGLQLVRNLTHQLRGRLSVRAVNPGTEFGIAFRA